MDIDITFMINDANRMPELSGNQLELGDNAGKITWDNSLDYAKTFIPLKTPEEIKNAKKYFQSFGAWSEDEINQWNDHETNALLIQLIAGDIREYSSFDTYENYLIEAEKGSVSSNIFRGDDNKFYFYVGE